MSFSQHKEETRTISTVTLIKVVVFAVVIWFFYFIRDILALLFVALILSSALSPWVASMERRKVPRIISILLIYLCIIGILLFVLYLIIPPLSQEYTAFVLNFPEYSNQITNFIHQYNPEINVVEQVRKSLSALQSNLPQLAGQLFVKIYDIIKGFLGVFLVFVVTFYMVIEEEIIRKTVRLVTPNRYHSYIEEMVIRVQKKIGQWFRGQMILCLIIFSITYVGLMLLGVKYALTLALIAGLTEFFPVIGPAIGAVPALFIAFTQSPLLALWVLFLYWIIQRLENDLIVPRVMKYAVGINPLVSIIAILIGGKIGGIAGILLAVPVATILMTITSDFFDNDEDENEESVQIKKSTQEGSVSPHM